MIKKKLKQEAAKKAKDSKSKGSVDAPDASKEKGGADKDKKKKPPSGKQKSVPPSSEKTKKLKEYENVETTDPKESGVKQRKSNKRLKDYEVGGGEEAKKDA